MSVSFPVKPQARSVNISRSCPRYAAAIIGVVLQSQNMRLELQSRVSKQHQTTNPFSVAVRMLARAYILIA